MNTNQKLFNLQKELVFLRVKQKTKQSTKTHLLKKIKYQISKILTSNT
uniref:Ribosomal protein L29 n=1 Tax=Chondria sp. (in: red algae) TaxID=1982705 RepID=A0A1Z1MQX3_9FLOR|nr:ribosomal protein L29 [Chondria sp. (in: red algae)]